MDVRRARCTSLLLPFPLLVLTWHEGVSVLPSKRTWFEWWWNQLGHSLGTEDEVDCCWLARKHHTCLSFPKKAFDWTNTNYTIPSRSKRGLGSWTIDKTDVQCTCLVACWPYPGNHKKVALKYVLSCTCTYAMALMVLQLPTSIKSSSMSCKL